MKNRLSFPMDLFLFALALVLLVPGFYENSWEAAGRKWFTDWQKNSDHMVVARLVQSRQAGVLSYGALLGFGDLTAWEQMGAGVIEHAYDVYLNGGSFTAYWPYTSVPGFQGIGFSLFDQATNFAAATTLKIFRGFEAVLSAVVLALLLLWLKKEFGLSAALGTLAFMVLSEWLALYGGSLYWNLWAFYLPLLATTFLLARGSGQVVIATTLFACMLLKSLFNGFEFITTALLMPFVPFVYYALRDAWGWRLFLTRMLGAGLAAAAGVFAGLGVLYLQVTSALGSYTTANKMILDSLLKRSIGDPTSFSGIEAESLRANVFSVLWTYLNGRALYLNNIFHPLAWLGGLLEVKYITLFLLFALFSLLFILGRRAMSPSTLRTGNALLAATWFSALAPLSWFIIFKAHSYIHLQLNYIVWQMPFTLFGFALCGFVLQALFVIYTASISTKRSI